MNVDELIQKLQALSPEDRQKKVMVEIMDGSDWGSAEEIRINNSDVSITT